MEIPEEILYNRNKEFQKARGGGGMKVLVIPDVHLKPFMFQQAAELMRQGIAERAVLSESSISNPKTAFSVLFKPTFLWN